MIHIITNDEVQAIKTAKFLTNNRLLLDATILEKVPMFQREDQGTTSNVKTVLIGKTKALLFDTIDQALRERYPEDMPELYSVPIVHMDWEQAKHLREETAKVWGFTSEDLINKMQIEPLKSENGQVYVIVVKCTSFEEAKSCVLPDEYAKDFELTPKINSSLNLRREFPYYRVAQRKLE